MNIRFIVISLLCIASLDATITVKLFTGNEIEQFEYLIVEQRLFQFSQFPYLMNQGDEFERFYAQCYTNAPSGALAVAYTDEGHIAGFLTGMSLKDFDAYWQPFHCEQIADKLDGQIDQETNYYLGDVIVLEKYRGNKIADQLFEALGSVNEI